MLGRKAISRLAESHILEHPCAEARLALTSQACAQGAYNVAKQKQGLRAKEDSAAAEAPEERAAAKAPSGKSLTALLQSRSEAMVPLSEQAPAVPDIDAKDHGDPLAASVYVRDIFSFYKRIEGNFRPSPDYMSRQVLLSEALGCACFASAVCAHRWTPVDASAPSRHMQLTDATSSPTVSSLAFALVHSMLCNAAHQ